MKLRRTYDIYEIELSKTEYIEIAEQHNELYADKPEHMYDIDEMKITLDENKNTVITQNMLDDCEDGFWMWSENFWMLFLRYTEFPYDTENFEIEA